MTLSVLIRAQLLLFGALALASSWLDARCFAGAWLGLLIFFYLISAQSLIWSSMSGLVYGMATVGVSFFWAPQMLAKTLAADEGDWLPVLVFTALIVWEAIPFARSLGELLKAANTSHLDARRGMGGLGVELATCLSLVVGTHADRLPCVGAAR
jgi:hypothetical protein